MDNNNKKQNQTIQFDESQAHSNEKLTQKMMSRTSTGRSSSDFDTRSVRSVIMSKMNLVKRRRKNADQGETVEGPPYHTMDLDTVAQILKSDLEDGLSDDVIEERRVQYNEMEGEGGVSPLKLLMKQFMNIMVLILLIAMVRISIHHLISFSH
jgi:magnesium-transporting ATPase (P-type)